MHFETSAKNNVGVEDLFLSLTNMVRKIEYQFDIESYTHTVLRFNWQMIEANDAKRNQENALNRSNSFRRPNSIIVAEEEETDGDADQQRSLTARCCGNG